MSGVIPGISVIAPCADVGWPSGSIRRVVWSIVLDADDFVYPRLLELIVTALRGVHLPKDLYAYVQLESSLTHAVPTTWRFKSIDVMLHQLHSRLDEAIWRWLFATRRRIYFRSVWNPRADVFLASELTDGWFRDGIVRRRDIPLRWRVKIRWHRTLDWMLDLRRVGK